MDGLLEFLTMRDKSQRKKNSHNYLCKLIAPNSLDRAVHFCAHNIQLCQIILDKSE